MRPVDSYGAPTAAEVPLLKGLLVRVGCDQTPDGGRWNAPVDCSTGRFCYVPIPESKANRPGLAKPYSLIDAYSG